MVKQARFAALAMLSAELGSRGSRHLGVITVLTDEETEGQRGEVTLPMSLSLKGEGMGFNL